MAPPTRWGWVWLGEAPRQPRGPRVLVGPSSGCNLASVGGAQGSVVPSCGPVRSSNGGEGGLGQARRVVLVEGGRGVGRGVCGSGMGLLSPLINWVCVVPPLLLVGGRKGAKTKHENEGGAILDLKYKKWACLVGKRAFPLVPSAPPSPPHRFRLVARVAGVGAPPAVDFGCPKDRKPGRHLSAESGRNDCGRQ